VIYTVNATLPGGAPGQEYWATDLAGNGRPLGVQFPLTYDNPADPNEDITRYVSNGNWNAAVRQGGALWFLAAKRYHEPRTTSSSPWIVRTVELVAVREGNQETFLASDVDCGLDLLNLGVLAFIDGGSQIMVAADRTDGSDYGVWTASVTWTSGTPTIGTFGLRYPSTTTMKAPCISRNHDRVVFGDGTALVAAEKGSGGAWSTRTLATGQSGILGRLSPDATRVMYETSEGIRFVQFDGSGDVLAIAGTGEGSASGNGTYVGSGPWSPDSTHFAYYWYKSTDTSTTWSMCWAPAKARSKGTQINAVGRPAGWVQ
jgi:hypothetical protein